MPARIRLLLLITITIWSTSYVAIRYALAAYSPGALAFDRYLVASLCMTIFYFRRPTRHLPTLSEWMQLLVLGVLGFGFYNYALNSSEITIDAGLAGFIVGQAPIFVALFALLFLNERLNVAGYLGVAIGVVGLSIIAYGTIENWHFAIGLFWVLAATFSLSVFLVFQRPLLSTLHPIEFATLTMWFGTMSLLYFAPSGLETFVHAPIVYTLSAIYLGVVPAAIGYAIWTYAASKVQAAKAASFLYISPFITMVLGWALLSEIPRLTTIVGGVIAILGAYTVNQSKQSLLSRIVDRLPRRRYLLSGGPEYGRRARFISF